MDPNRIIQALKGTIDPNLRLAAENELNQVSDPSREVWCFFRKQKHDESRDAFSEYAKLRPDLMHKAG